MTGSTKHELATAIVCTIGPITQRLEERIQQYSMFQNQFEINLNFKKISPDANANPLKMDPFINSKIYEEKHNIN